MRDLRCIFSVCPLSRTKLMWGGHLPEIFFVSKESTLFGEKCSVEKGNKVTFAKILPLAPTKGRNLPPPPVDYASGSVGDKKDNLQHRLI